MVNDYLVRPFGIRQYFGFAGFVGEGACVLRILRAWCDHPLASLPLRPFAIPRTLVFAAGISQIVHTFHVHLEGFEDSGGGRSRVVGDVVGSP